MQTDSTSGKGVDGGELKRAPAKNNPAGPQLLPDSGYASLSRPDQLQSKSNNLATLGEVLDENHKNGAQDEPQLDAANMIEQDESRLYNFQNRI